jgi:dihydrodipicolinate synthase/N-acetylneuraminate lyase
LLHIDPLLIAPRTKMILVLFAGIILYNIPDSTAAVLFSKLAELKNIVTTKLKIRKIHKYIRAEDFVC